MPLLPRPAAAALLLLVTAVPAAARAQAARPSPLAPSASYAPEVPTPRAVLGHGVAERFTPHHAVREYLQRLDAASERVRVEQYGTSTEGRPLLVAYVSAPATLARLDAVRADNARLADPRRTPAADAARLAQSAPTVIWLGYGVHGNESNSTEAAMQVAYELAASRDARVAEWLKNVLVIIDPVQNPDGRERYVQGFAEALGAAPRPDRHAAEHSERWPGGRWNHYLFDLNRDWAWQSQAETVARTRLFLQWNPQLHVDLHEMGPEMTYHFPPPADPQLASVMPGLGKWYAAYGQGNAAWFDRQGYRFFTRELFDLYYPSFGDSWPALQGAVGMTYEVAGGGSAGLAVQLPDDERLLRLEDRVARHVVASLATIDTSSRTRAERLRDYVEFRRAAVRAGESGPVRAYYLPPGGDRQRLARLVRVLQGNGVEVQLATGEAGAGDLTGAFGESAGGRKLPAGTVAVDLAQPQGLLARALLEREARSVGQPFFYDVSAWSLPLAMGVEAYAGAKAPGAGFRPLPPGEPLPFEKGELVPAPGGGAPAAWVVSWRDTGAVALLARLLDEGVRAYTSLRGFTVAGEDFPPGSLVVPVEVNDAARVAQRLAALAPATGARVVAVGSGAATKGLDLGSPRVRYLRPPRVAVLMDRPVSAPEYGALWHLLEQRLGVPFTPVRADALGGLALDEYNVLVLPPDSGDGAGWARVLTKDALGRLRAWVHAGGTLIGLRGGAVALTRREGGLTRATYRWVPPEQEDARRRAHAARAREDKDGDEALPEDKEPEPSKEEQERARAERLARRLRPYAEREAQALRDTIPGTILRGAVDVTHPLGFGLEPRLALLNRTSPVLELSDAGEHVVHYPKDALRVAGFLTPEAEKKLGLTAYAVRERVGRGHVVLFAENPAFRGFWEGTARLLANAIYFGHVVDPQLE